MARPTIFTQELADKIAERIAEGETLKSILSESGMPNASTVFRWEIANQEFCMLLTRAREAGAHAIIGESREIADDGRNDWMEKFGRDGESCGWMVNGEAVARSRLRVDQRWKEASALAPRTYGQKYAVEHSGGINVSLTNASDDDLVNEINELLATGRLKLPTGVQLVDEEGEPPADDDPYGVG